MKIWVQSCAPLGDATRSDYQQALKRQAQGIIRPDTVVEFHGMSAQIPGMPTSHTGEQACGWQSVRNAIQAEQEGYDAFVMASMFDSGYYGIREMVDIPVVFITEASLHIALMLAHKFAFLSINPMIVLRFAEQVKRYGLAERLVHGGYINMSYANDFPKMFKDPAPYIDIITKAVEEIVARGADIILPGPVPISAFLVEQGIREINGARILDVSGCALKMAEMMVDLHANGLTRSKHGLFTAPPKELMPALRKLYQVKWETE